ncbi:pectin lyase-like superfamily protein [Actinidia rufa]|uniref:pectinesterase n=1 Tax=Actinidia rufa TaxID=165716 RepID=A0A7J0E1T2_9ERIC|nr:pectin lyase-like superfamily protein [Actinidia rufa]
MMLKLFWKAHQNWVKLMGSFNHSLLQKASNKFTACRTIKVHKNPKKGDFVSVQGAINSLPLVNLCRVVISVSAGIYREKVVIPATMAYISLEGEGAAKTIIEWDDTADRRGKDGKPLGTYASATVAVNSPYFIAKNIAFKGCHLHAKTNSFGALTAQKRESFLEETGFSFVKCRVTGSGALYLGRAWGTFSRVVFAYTYMDKIITSRGWADWGLYSYGQYKCWGPGAEYGGRVSWSRELTKQEVQPFISLKFIDGYDWLP